MTNSYEDALSLADYSPPSLSPILYTPLPEQSADIIDLTDRLALIEMQDDSNSATPPGSVDAAAFLQQFISAMRTTTPSAPRDAYPKPIAWPQWDGKKETYALFKFTIKSKLAQEKGRLGEGQAICTNIFNGLPVEKRQRVIFWLQEEGEKTGFDPERFLGHMDMKFVDTEGEKKALNKLNRLRQGDRQKFEDFRQEFEQLAAEAGSLSHQGASKIACMEAAIHKDLSRALISVDTSNSEYDVYVTKVQSIATNFEAHPDFRGQTGSTKHYYVSDDRERSVAKSSPHRMDSDGDVEMSGINALIAQVATLQAQISAIGASGGSSHNRDNRPRAQWLARTEWRILRDSGKCGRCKKPRHANGNECAFRAAHNPGPTRVAAIEAAIASPAKESLLDLSDDSEN